MLYKKKILSVFVKLLILLFLYQIGRFCFLLMNRPYFATTSSIQLIDIFIKGTLFDISAICNISILFVLAYLIPMPFIFNKRYLRVVNILFYTISGLSLLFNFIDCEYFRYINKRATFDIFTFIFVGRDTFVLLPRFLFDFWYIPLLWILSCLLGYWLIKRADSFIFRESPRQTERWWLWAIPQYIVVIIVIAVGVRGLGFKPIQLITASKYTNTLNFPLIYNTPFTILHTMKGDALNQKHYFSEQKAKTIFNPICNYYKGGESKHDNVVIIILESFSFDYVGRLSHKKSYTPFLDSIIGESLAFDNAFANGKKSIEALPSIFASLPNLLDEPYITSQYGGNCLKGLPSILKERGYTTSFFHGGRNGTMGFDNFCKAVGIEHYYGMNEYKGPEAYDGDWGIRDEEFLQFYAKELHSFHQPFFSSIFTLSSHHPYLIPEKYKGTFKGGKLPIYKAIQYADYSLKQFFKTISKEPWFKNTLFVFTADHAAQEEDYFHKKNVDLFRIPILFYHPGDVKMKNINHQVIQQADIMPTIIDYLNVKDSFLCFGKSVFDNSAKHLAIEYLGGVYSIVEGNYSISFDGEHFLEKATIVDSPKVALNSTFELQMQQTLKAIIQQFNNRLITNKLAVEKN